MLSLKKEKVLRKSTKNIVINLERITKVIDYIKLCKYAGIHQCIFIYEYMFKHTNKLFYTCIYPKRLIKRGKKIIIS